MCVWACVANTTSRLNWWAHYFCSQNPLQSLETEMHSGDLCLHVSVLLCVCVRKRERESGGGAFLAPEHPIVEGILKGEGCMVAKDDELSLISHTPTEIIKPCGKYDLTRTAIKNVTLKDHRSKVTYSFLLPFTKLSTSRLNRMKQTEAPEKHFLC